MTPFWTIYISNYPNCGNYAVENFYIGIHGYKEKKNPHFLLSPSVYVFFLQIMNYNYYLLLYNNCNINIKKKKNLLLCRLYHLIRPYKFDKILKILEWVESQKAGFDS